MIKIEDAQKQVDNNYNFFKTKIVSLKEKYLNKFALLHDQEILEFFDSEDDAIKIGTRDYGEGCFSVQQVNDQPADLGYQSYVIV